MPEFRSPTSDDRLPPYAWEAFRALSRGLARDESGRLSLALEGVRWRLWARGRGWLENHHVRLAALALARRRPLLGMMAAVIDGTGWRPSDDEDDGWTAVHTIPVVDWSPLDPTSRAACVEIVAVDAADPERWWPLTGAVEILGDRLVWNWLSDAAPVRLVRTPLDWARLGGETADAACLLNPAGEASRRVLLDAASLVCADPDPAQRLAHGEHLARLQRKLRPPLPSIQWRDDQATGFGRHGVEPLATPEVRP
jgi:hypothetical protein